MDRAWGRLSGPLLWASLLLALAAHIGLFILGFERLSNDDAARVLMSLSLTAENALEPWIWPPLHRVILGLALKLHEDVVWVPRLLSIAAALGVMLALLRLTSRISDDVRVLLAAALLAIVTPYRLLLGTVPMADIFMLLFVVAGAERVLAWLQEGRGRNLLIGCALIGLATAVRYEAWFIAACLGLMLAWRWWRSQPPSFGMLAAAGVLLSWFPLFWIGNSWVWYGSLENLAITPIQFQAITGEDAGRQALLMNPLLGMPFWKEVAWNPASWLGAIALVRLARRDATLRDFALGFLTSLPLMGLTLIAVTAVSGAATWRLVGAWSLLLLPFGALALVWLADWAAARLRAPRAAALVVVVLPALLLLTVRDQRLARAEMFNWTTGTWRHDTEAGRAAVAELKRLGGGLIVVDSIDNLDFLEVMVGSGAPKLFVTSADAPAPEVALYVPMGPHLRRLGESELVDRYLTDRFGLAGGGDPAALAARGIRLALVRDPAQQAALEASPAAELVERWPDWALYRLGVTVNAAEATSRATDRAASPRTASTTMHLSISDGAR